MKKIIYLSLATIMILCLTVGCGCNKKETKEEINNIEEKDNIKVNTNKDVTKEQQLEVFTFTNTSLIYEDNTSILKIKVTNTSSETQYLEEFKIHVKDELGNEIVELKGFVGNNIPGNSSTVITSSYAEDLTKAAAIEYEITR